MLGLGEEGGPRERGGGGPRVDARRLLDRRKSEAMAAPTTGGRNPNRLFLVEGQREETTTNMHVNCSHGPK